MLKKFYRWFYKKISNSKERGEYSAGVWPHRIRQKVINLCREYKGGKLLEVGCGEGLFILNLATANPQLEIVGIDNNISGLLSTREKCENKKFKNVKLIYADAVNLPINDEYFDCLVCINTFLNLESIKVVNHILGQMARVCKKKGKIFFDFRNSLNPFLRLKYKLAPYYDSTIEENKLPLNTYYPKDIEDILRKLNFKIINRIYIGFPLKMLAPIIIIEAEKC